MKETYVWQFRTLDTNRYLDYWVVEKATGYDITSDKEKATLFDTIHIPKDLKLLSPRDIRVCFYDQTRHDTHIVALPKNRYN